MKCNVCGAENKEGAQFCRECGKALIDEPIKLELEQIKIPASSRKAHIVKVSASKKSREEEKDIPAEPENNENGGEYIDLSAPKADKEAEKTKTENEQESDAPVSDRTEEPMKMRNWIPVFILQLIPCVNIIMLFVWAFSSGTNKSKKSYARVTLIFTAVMLVVFAASGFVYIRFFNPDFSALKFLR